MWMFLSSLQAVKAYTEDGKIRPIAGKERKKEHREPKIEGQEDGTPPPHRERKERKQTNPNEGWQGMGKEDRVHTCTSRILEGRSSSVAWLA